MDATEPDHLGFKPEDMDTKTNRGSFRKVHNAFPLMTVGGVYDNQRAETYDKRVFILTLAGLSHLHLSGTGIGDLADISFLPVTSGVSFTQPLLINLHL